MFWVFEGEYYVKERVIYIFCVWCFFFFRFRLNFLVNYINILKKIKSFFFREVCVLYGFGDVLGVSCCFCILSYCL